MFERYTEKARRVIFFGRYEASAFGGQYLETEHLLLGILREDQDLLPQLGLARDAAESIRKAIERRIQVGKRMATSVDMPLSHASKRVLAYGAEESERLGSREITQRHVFLGLLRETSCTAAEVLREHGVSETQVRDLLALTPRTPPDGS